VIALLLSVTATSQAGTLSDWWKAFVKRTPIVIVDH
jgi:hypothetical protein